MDLHQLAVKVSETEGGRVNLPVAQIKEVLSIALAELWLFAPAWREKLCRRAWENRQRLLRRREPRSRHP